MSLMHITKVNTPIGCGLAEEEGVETEPLAVAGAAAAVEQFLTGGRRCEKCLSG